MCHIPGCQCHPSTTGFSPLPQAGKKLALISLLTLFFPPGSDPEPTSPADQWEYGHLPAAWVAASLGLTYTSLLQRADFGHQIPFCLQEWGFEEQHPKRWFFSLVWQVGTADPWNEPPFISHTAPNHPSVWIHLPAPLLTFWAWYCPWPPTKTQPGRVPVAFRLITQRWEVGGSVPGSTGTGRTNVSAQP